MFRKSFVSIYFTPSKILVFQLSSNKKNVKRKVSVDLPEDVLSDNKVLNVSNLAKILAKIWSEYRIKEKLVSLVLPEIVTYTKIFRIPRLKISELDEAVRWQVQEFLPIPLQQLILDWKIVNKNDKEFEILVVAVKKEILLSYVKALEGAGLWPILVETPSICLSRLSNLENGALFIYKNASETLIVLTNAKELIGNSVVKSEKKEDIVKTLQRMLSHFNQIKIESVFLCGTEIGSDFISEIKNFDGVSTKIVKLEIEKLKDSYIQEFIIPFTSQLGEISEPKNPKTINLLPLPLVEKYNHEKIKLQVWTLSLALTLFIWVPFLFTLLAYLFMVQQINSLKAQNIDQKNKTEKEKIVQKISDINLTSEKILSIKRISINPLVIINQINSAVNSGINLNSYSVDLEKGVIELTGIALNRDSLINFKNSLEKISDFSSVDIPISSFEKEKDLNFNATLTLKKQNAQKDVQRPSI